MQRMQTNRILSLWVVFFWRANIYSKKQIEKFIVQITIQQFWYVRFEIFMEVKV
jgi:hypothetical protein